MSSDPPPYSQRNIAGKKGLPSDRHPENVTLYQTTAPFLKEVADLYAPQLPFVDYSEGLPRPFTAEEIPLDENDEDVKVLRAKEEKWGLDRSVNNGL